MKKRFAGAVTAVCLALSLVGCGGDTPGAQNTSLPPQTPQSAGESLAPDAQSALPESPVPEAFQDGGIFSAYYDDAYEKLTAMTTEEKVGQLFWARCPETQALQEIADHHLGGLVLFKRDFADLTAEEVRERLASYQGAAEIPLLLAADEEGGEVARISAWPALRPEGRFEAQGDLYADGGLEGLLADTEEKDALLSSLGLNVNLAPVADIARNPEDFMYGRSLRQDAAVTSAAVRAMTTRMLSDGIQPVLKHFPGYGDNADTHTGIAVDKRPYEQFQSEDLLPFQAGIAAGAPCVLVSHNIVNCMDDTLPASLSPAVHNILRTELGHTGVITTDELDMGAIKEFTDGENPCVQALLAGNDMLMVTDYQGGIEAVLAAVEAGTVSKETLDHAVFRILAWKYSMGLLSEG